MLITKKKKNDGSKAFYSPKKMYAVSFLLFFFSYHISSSCFTDTKTK